MSVRSFIFSFSVAFAFGAIPLMAQTLIALTPKQAECISKNVGLYLEPGIEPVVVIPKTCPEPPSLDDLMIILAPQNLGRDLPEPKLGEPDAALVLMPAELKCFETRYAAGDLTIKEDGLIVVTLEDCDG